MKWQNLYSAKRTGSQMGSPASPEIIRNSFQRDYDRLIFSSAFRRLQNKTQVFPLPGAVFVHNRLTHSLEVASVGRSLGKSVGTAIAEKYKHHGDMFIDFYNYELPSVIAAACLAHDIGNPPFGHSGEDAIRTFFNEIKGEFNTRFYNELSVNQQRDFLFFEGNANALRTLTHSFNEPIRGGFQLTCTTLASIVKYPCDSLSGFNKQHLFTKKSGFFDSEIPVWNEIAGLLELNRFVENKNVFVRHPFVYLVEAADDICYRIIDFEDAHRLGILSFEKIAALFLAFFDNETGYNERSKVEDTLQNINDPNQKVQYLRALIIGLLVQKIGKVFLEKEDELLSGGLEKSLMDYLPAFELELIKSIDKYSVENIYKHRSVVEIEIAGYNVIGALLMEFIQALIAPKNTKAVKLLQLIPQQFVVKGAADSLYNDLQAVVDFISGMTDLYAVDMYRKIPELNLGSLNRYETDKYAVGHNHKCAGIFS